MTHDYSDLSLPQVQGVSKRVNLVKIAIIKIISIFGHPECALQSGEKKPPQSSSVDAVNDDGDDGDNLEEDAE